MLWCNQTAVSMVWKINGKSITGYIIINDKIYTRKLYVLYYVLIIIIFFGLLQHYMYIKWLIKFYVKLLMQTRNQVCCKSLVVIICFLSTWSVLHAAKMPIIYSISDSFRSLLPIVCKYLIIFMLKVCVDI